MKQFVFVVAFCMLGMIKNVQAMQLLPRVECGDTVTSEFTESNQGVDYLIALQPGDTVQVTASAFGDYLTFLSSQYYRYSAIFSPSNTMVARSETYEAPTLNMASRVLGERGDYIIRFRNDAAFGAFTFSITCTRNGQEFNAALPISNATVQNEPPVSSAPSEFTGIGFAGLTPIDFSTVALFPLILDLPITASLAPQETSVFGLSFTANSGDVLDISAQRSVGDLGVGFVIFAKPNTLVFIAGPVSASTFSTQVTLPQTGEYVIGLFRMGELPPGAQATAFQITASINP